MFDLIKDAYKNSKPSGKITKSILFKILIITKVFFLALSTFWLVQSDKGNIFSNRREKNIICTSSNYANIILWIIRNNSLSICKTYKSISIYQHSISKKFNIKYAISISNNKKLTGIHEQKLKYSHGKSYNVLLKDFIISL